MIHPHDVGETGGAAGGGGGGGVHHVPREGLTNLLVVDGRLGLPSHLAGNGNSFIHVQHHDLERRLGEHGPELRGVDVCSISRVEMCVKVLDEFNLHGAVIVRVWGRTSCTRDPS